MEFMTRLMKSRTIVFNVAMLIAGLMTYLLNSDIIKQYPDVVAGLVTAAGAINVVLRFLTVSSLFGKIDEIKLDSTSVKTKK